MASTLSTTTQPPGSQPLCESLNTTLELCDLARQVALHLETPSSLERITREGEEVFRIKWMKQFEDLANEVIKTAAPKVQERAAIAGVKIRARKQRDATGGVLLVNAAMLSSRQDEYHILLPLPISEQAHNRVIHRIQELLPTLKPYAYTPENIKLCLQSEADREKREELAFVPDRIYVNFEAVRYGTRPPLRPFLMIPVFIVRATEEQHGA